MDNNNVFRSALFLLLFVCLFLFLVFTWLLLLLLLFLAFSPSCFVSLSSHTVSITLNAFSAFHFLLFLSFFSLVIFILVLFFFFALQMRDSVDVCGGQGGRRREKIDI